MKFENEDKRNLGTKVTIQNVKRWIPKGMLFSMLFQQYQFDRFDIFTRSQPCKVDPSR